MERTRAPLGERRLVFFSTALVLLFFLAGFVYLGVGAWRQYRNSIIDNQKEQMLLTTQALSRNMEILSRTPSPMWRYWPSPPRS